MVLSEFHFIRLLVTGYAYRHRIYMEITTIYKIDCSYHNGSQCGQYTVNSMWILLSF